MGRQKGFTLLELLVVIAIIAVLTAIVIVALDPVKRINDATDRVAASNVRATGTLISVCIAKRLAETQTYEECADPFGGYATISSYGNKPDDVDLVAGGGAPPDNDVCAAQQGSITHYYVFKHSEGQVVPNDGKLSDVAASVWCPL